MVGISEQEYDVISCTRHFCVTLVLSSRLPLDLNCQCELPSLTCGPAWEVCQHAVLIATQPVAWERHGVARLQHI